MRKTFGTLLAVGALALATGPSARAGDDLPPLPKVKEEIAWSPSLAAAYERAKKEGIPVFVAINAVRVDGGRVEPAGAMLRDEVYRDPAVVAKSKSFSCALLTSDGNSADYGELRGRYGIDGNIVSPQHVLAHANGELIERREYWSVRGTEASVAALIQMMDAALMAHRAKSGQAAPDGSTPDEQRTTWIRERLEKVRQGSSAPEARDVAAKELVAGDKGGDCVEPLCGVLLELKKDVPSRCSILKILGKPGLEIAIPTVVQLLDDKEDDVRANAAVTLEYIGSARAIEPLTKRAPKEKDEVIANHVYRALGRCGAKQEPVRKTLLRAVETAKSGKSLAGPAIGLAYFEKDADVARALEKAAKKEGDRPRRGILLWALSEVKDPASGAFVKEQIIPGEKERLALAYDQAIADLLLGEDLETARGVVDNGMGWLLGAVGASGGSARRDRDQSAFKPKGEFPWGGRPGGRGGPGGDPGMGGGGMGD